MNVCGFKVKVIFIVHVLHWYTNMLVSLKLAKAYLSLKLYAFDFRQIMDGFFAQMEKLIALCQKDVAIKPIQRPFYVALLDTSVSQVKFPFNFITKVRAIFRTCHTLNC